VLVVLKTSEKDYKETMTIRPWAHDGRRDVVAVHVCTGRQEMDAIRREGREAIARTIGAWMGYEIALEDIEVRFIGIDREDDRLPWMIPEGRVAWLGSFMVLRGGGGLVGIPTDVDWGWNEMYGWPDSRGTGRWMFNRQQGLVPWQANDAGEE